MAIEICSDNSSMGTSPRISFSHDFSPTEGVPIEQYIRTTSSSSSIDFDFCVFRENFDQESSSADELFFDGKILPIEIKRKLGTSSPKKSHSSSAAAAEAEATTTDISAQTSQPLMHDYDNFDRIKSLKTDKISSENKRGGSESDEKTNSKSFWRFKRSSSLNCGSGYARSLCPLPLLNRSNSTGSAPNGKRSSLGKDSNLSNKQNSAKQSAQSASSSAAGGYQKPPLKKSYRFYGSSGTVKVTPVLNVPSPSMFGFGSIFSPSKDKSKKK